MDRQVVDLLAVVAAFSLFVVSFPVLISACDNSTSAAAGLRDCVVTGNLTDGLCSQVIQPLGYICSEHIVQTEDKFLLGLQRVSSSKANSEGKKGPPVLLLHGLFMGGEAWFLNGIDNSLGFLLADKGYDVWVGNVRGVQWSPGHVSLSKLDKEFWAWSWTELAKFDLPAMLNYVNNITNSKVFVIGHSQGTLMSIVGFTNQELANKVNGAAFLCPIAYLHWVEVPIIRMAVLLHVDNMVTDDIPSIDLRSAIGTHTMRDLCRGDAEYCKNLVRSLTGENCCFDIQKVNNYLRFGPQPTSTRNLAHLAKMVRSGYITVYDYGQLGNIDKYGRFNAPSFNLSEIPASIPMWFASGENDPLSDSIDVRNTLSELQQSPRETAALEVPNYGHLDFLFSWSAKKDVYDSLFLFLGNHTSTVDS
ncbi:triacylglycerol lipase 1-like [Apium graveolens]|uniref:triacylglycerol lipase 1-like n=1 Tax=Apium graveolens TaxID=4045 RepID=UPI003D7BEB83